MAEVLITRGAADGGWSDDIASCLHAVDPTGRSATVRTNHFNPTYPTANTNNVVLDLSSVANYPSPLVVTQANYHALHGILRTGAVIPGFLAATYQACRPIFHRFTHLVVPPTGAKAIPLIMHEYAPELTRGGRWVNSMYPGMNPDHDKMRVNLGAPNENYYEKYTEYDLPQYFRSLMIEMALIIAAFRIGIPIYATCHGAQLVWFLLGGQLHKMPRVQESGWNSNGMTSVSIVGGMLKIRSVRRGNRQPFYFSPHAGVGRSRDGSFEHSERSPAPFNRPRIPTSGGLRPSQQRLVELMDRISHFDFMHTTYMVGTLDGVRQTPHPLSSSMPSGPPRQIGTLFADARSMVGTFQFRSVYGFQHHPHRVYGRDPAARRFFEEFLEHRGADSVAWL